MYYLLLLHQFRIRAIIHNALAEDGCRQRGIDLFGIDIFQLGVEYKLVPLCSQAHRRLLAQQDEREYVSILPIRSVKHDAS